MLAKPHPLRFGPYACCLLKKKSKYRVWPVPGPKGLMSERASCLGKLKFGELSVSKVNELKSGRCLAWRGQERRIVTFSMLKVVDISVSQVCEVKSLSSLARAGADGRDFLSI